LQLNKDNDAIQHPFGMTGAATDLFPASPVLFRKRASEALPRMIVARRVGMAPRNLEFHGTISGISETIADLPMRTGPQVRASGIRAIIETDFSFLHSISRGLT
jgi:hypothetical protein